MSFIKIRINFIEISIILVLKDKGKVEAQTENIKSVLPENLKFVLNINYSSKNKSWPGRLLHVLYVGALRK